MSITTGRSVHRARLTSQGQVTIPKAVRDAMGANPGDELEFERAGGAFIVRHRPRINVLDLAGTAAKSARRVPRTAEKIDEAIGRAAGERALEREARLRRSGR